MDLETMVVATTGALLAAGVNLVLRPGCSATGKADFCAAPGSAVAATTNLKPIAELPPFRLERFFAEFEFVADRLLCCSDAEPVSMAELLDMADAECRQLWDSLSLGYTETSGLPLLRQQIASLYRTVDAEHVVVVPPQEGIFLCMNSLLKAGDHVVCMSPAYQSLHAVAASKGCDVSFWRPSTESGNFELAELQQLVSKHTKLVVINFPHNPTGAMLSRDNFVELVELCRVNDAILFSDEMYRMMEVDPSATRLPNACDIYEKAVSLCGISKSLSCPGIRIGWLATRHSPLLQGVQQYHDYTSICNSAPSELLALMALRASDTILARNMGIVRDNLKILRAFFARHLDKFEWTEPMAGTMCFPKVKTCVDGASVELYSRRLVKATGILLLPATLYDGYEDEPRFRLGFGRRNFAANLDAWEKILDGSTGGDGQPCPPA